MQSKHALTAADVVSQLVSASQRSESKRQQTTQICLPAQRCNGTHVLWWNTKTSMGSHPDCLPIVDDVLRVTESNNNNSHTEISMIDSAAKFIFHKKRSSHVVAVLSHSTAQEVAAAPRVLRRVHHNQSYMMTTRLGEREVSTQRLCGLLQLKVVSWIFHACAAKDRSESRPIPLCDLELAFPFLLSFSADAREAFVVQAVQLFAFGRLVWYEKSVICVKQTEQVVYCPLDRNQMRCTSMFELAIANAGACTLWRMQQVEHCMNIILDHCHQRQHVSLSTSVCTSVGVVLQLFRLFIKPPRKATGCQKSLLGKLYYVLQMCAEPATAEWLKKACTSSRSLAMDSLEDRLQAHALTHVPAQRPMSRGNEDAISASEHADSFFSTAMVELPTSGVIQISGSRWKSSLVSEVPPKAQAVLHASATSQSITMLITCLATSVGWLGLMAATTLAEAIPQVKGELELDIGDICFDSASNDIMDSHGSDLQAVLAVRKAARRRRRE